MFTLPPALCSERFIDPTLTAVKQLIDQAAAEAKLRMPVDVMTAVDGRKFEEAVCTREQYRAVIAVLGTLSCKLAEAMHAHPVERPAEVCPDYELPDMPRPSSATVTPTEVIPMEALAPQVASGGRKRKVS